MFGLRYDTKCPICGKVYEANHGITSYYKIRGKEHLGEYIEERHWECGAKYLRLCVDNCIFNMKESGISLEDAINKEIENKAKKLSYYKTLPEYIIESIKEECEHIYNNVTKDDLYLYYEGLTDDNLILSSSVCW